MEKIAWYENHLHILVIGFHMNWRAYLGYKIVVSVITVQIVCEFVPLAWGSYLDLQIFRLGLKILLGYIKRVIADMGCPDSKCDYKPDNLRLPDLLFPFAAQDIKMSIEGSISYM